MTKILFMFAGTNITAKNLATDDNYYGFKEDVIRVYFNGCQDKAIGGSYFFGQLSPNLDIVGERARSCFDNEGRLSITALKKNFGHSIIIKPSDTEKDALVDVESITLTGASRGAVTTFSVARHLDDLDKPIQLFARDPVPGESIEAAKDESSQFARNYNLSECTNITKAQVVLGGYRASVNKLHDVFFKQMAPVFNPLCESRIYTAPQKNHFSWSGASANQRLAFFWDIGLTNNSGQFHFSNSHDSKFFTPKVISQAPHAPEAIKLELLPQYKNTLIARLSGIHEAPEQLNEDSLQALFALQQHNGVSSAKKALEHAILNDHSPRGAALRDFVIEFENVNQHALRRSHEEKKYLVLEIHLKSLHLYDKFRESVYDQLSNLPLAPTSKDKETFINKTIEAIKELKGQIPYQKYKELKELTKLFLSEHRLLTTDFSSSIQAQNTTTAPLKPEAEMDATSAEETTYNYLAPSG